jgi:hypothetical protein
LLGVLLPLIIWLLKSFTYWIVFRIRAIPITVLSCLIIGGVQYILMFVPIPIPAFLSVPIAIGVAVYLTMHYTGVQLIPNGLFIPLGVEILFGVGFWVIQQLHWLSL